LGFSNITISGFIIDSRGNHPVIFDAEDILDFYSAASEMLNDLRKDLEVCGIDLWFEGRRRKGSHKGYPYRMFSGRGNNPK